MSKEERVSMSLLPVLSQIKNLLSSFREDLPTKDASLSDRGSCANRDRVGIIEIFRAHVNPEGV